MGYGIDPPASDLRLLLDEEIDADARLIVDMLDEELRSAQVTVVSSPADALSALDRDFDVIVADLSSQPYDGLGFVAAVQVAWPNTGYSQFDVMTRS